jgi:hypothetical protein
MHVSSHGAWAWGGRRTACNVDSTGSGRVVIWMVLPTMFATTNMSMPSWTSQHGSRPAERALCSPATSDACRAGAVHSRPPSLPRADATCAAGSGRCSGCRWMRGPRRLQSVARCQRRLRQAAARSGQLTAMLAPAESSTMAMAEAVVARRGCYLERRDMLCAAACGEAWVQVCVQRSGVAGCVTATVCGRPRDRGLGGRCAGSRDARRDDVGGSQAVVRRGRRGRGGRGRARCSAESRLCCEGRCRPSSV